MNIPAPILVSIVCLVFLLGVARVVRTAQNLGLSAWLLPYLLQTRKRRPVGRDDEVHLILCIADHFEPKFQDVPAEVANARVALWVDEYPRQFGGFRDSDNRPPRHTFFYPIDQYDPSHVEALASLCRDGYGEIEVHLHHHDDTAENLQAMLQEHKVLMFERHGVGARDRETGELAYAFIHGDWALDNSRPDGRYCGVNNELDVLRATGCYADLTMPSAPSPTQTQTINSLYYAVDDPCKPKSHDTGVAVGDATAPEDALLLIQGPLVLNWSRRKWGILPRVENGCIQGSQFASVSRLDNWLRARVQVASRPDWFFVKLHAHGAAESNHRAMLGEPMALFHHHLAQRAERDRRFHYHYVTAREMYNLVKAAEAGWAGSVQEARDFRLIWESTPPSILGSPRLASSQATFS